MHALLDTIARMGLPTEASRLFHGRGGLHPDSAAWCLDIYPPVWLLTCFGPLDEAVLARLQAALAARWQALAGAQPLNLVLQQRGAGRAHTRLLAGTVPEPHTVAEDGALYQVHLLRGQNHGLFLDMAAGRRWVRTWAEAQPGGRVLNLFAYSCAFSVAALRGGAAQVVNVDMADGVLAIGRRNHALNGVGQGAGGQARWLAHDVFSSWGKLTRLGPWDLVIADPPSHQAGSFVAAKDWPRLLRRLPSLLAPGGQALLCLNAPELPVAFLLEALAREAPTLQCVQRLANPAAFADVDPDRALKVLVVQAA